MAAFEEFGLMPELIPFIEQMGWTLPTEIQAEAIPLILGGGDVLMASETGSGKTGAFCLPIIQVVWETFNKSQYEKDNKPTKAKLPSQEWKLSFMDRAQDLVLSNDHLMAQSKSANWQGCRANKGVRRLKDKQQATQKYYFEVHFAEKGLARVGWSFEGSSLELGIDKFGWGFGGTAKKSNSRDFRDYGQPFGEKFDIVGCIADLKTGELSYTKNGRFMGVAFTIDTRELEKRALFPTICVKTAGCQVRFSHSQDINDYKPKDCKWVNDALVEQIVFTSLENFQEKDSKRAPLAIILEPSRELAEQTYNFIKNFSQDLNIKSALLVGGRNTVIESDVQIVVATPGRLSETIRDKLLNLHMVHFFILDEADGLLQQGQKNFITNVHNQIPKMFTTGRRLQTVCCSATLHNFDVKKMAQQLMYFPIWIDLKGEDSVPDTVHHVVLRIDPNRDESYRQLEGLFRTDQVHAKDEVVNSLYAPNTTLNCAEELSEAVKLMKFYYTLKAIECLKMDQGIIFCRTKLDCDNLEDFMMSMNEKTRSDRYSCTCLHADRKPQERTDNLEKFKQKKVKFLICTDVAARGIDVKNIPFVIQVTLPDEKANYLHRIGRVGRAERMGLAISLVATVGEKVWFHANCRNPRQCFNTNLKEKKGCCIWLDELSMLGDIENHLKCTIQEINSDFKIQVDEYDGKVVYGAKRLEQTYTYEGHVEQLKSLVTSLNELEAKAQSNYIQLYM